MGKNKRSKKERGGGEKKGGFRGIPNILKGGGAGKSDDQGQ